MTDLIEENRSDIDKLAEQTAAMGANVHGYTREALGVTMVKVAKLLARLASRQEPEGRTSIATIGVGDPAVLGLEPDAAEFSGDIPVAEPAAESQTEAVAESAGETEEQGRFRRRRPRPRSSYGSYPED